MSYPSFDIPAAPRAASDGALYPSDANWHRHQMRFAPVRHLGTHSVCTLVLLPSVSVEAR